MFSPVYTNSIKGLLFGKSKKEEIYVIGYKDRCSVGAINDKLRKNDFSYSFIKKMLEG